MAATRTTVKSGPTSTYRRRRPVPALVLFGILVLVASVVWISVARSSSDINANISCNQPAASPTSTTATSTPKPGQPLSHDALDQTDPVPSGFVQVRVFNASGQHNQATMVATALQQYGFGKAGEPDNDPLYPKGDMACYGQIRFGANGAGAARTLSMIEPCAQLVRDNRQDATVDLAVGKKFDDVKPNQDARTVLNELTAWAASQPNEHGGQLAQPAGHPPVSTELLASARSAQC